MNNFKIVLSFFLLFLGGESFSLSVRVEIGRNWQNLSIRCSTPFFLKNTTTGELLKERLEEVKISFLKKTQRFFCLKFSCSNEESAIRVEREVKTLGYDVERRGEEVVARCELEVGRRVLRERIEGEGILVTFFEEERKLARFEVEIEGEKIVLSSNSCLRLVPISAKENEPSLFSISLDNMPIRKFKGELEIFANSFLSTELINELDLEDYLKGVLPAEVSSDFPLEALKAQAIVARTYAVYSLGRHKNEGFDLCSGSHCQIYRGCNYEQTKLNDVIEQMKGMILSFGDKPALTPFHSSCGGIREDASVWGMSLPYLRIISDGLSQVPISSEESLKKLLQKRDGYNCEFAPSFRWTKEYSNEELQRIFSSSLPLLFRDPSLKVGKIKDISVLNRSSSGRVSVLKIEMEDKEIMLKGDDTRWAFGDGRPASKGSLPSLLFYIEKQKSGDKTVFKIIGGGAGHGIGFCQWGAVGLARKGYDFQKILSHYFPGTTLKNIYEK